MNKQSYETPVMTEFELLSEQTFLQTSANGGLSFGGNNQAGAETHVVNIWNNGQDF